MGQTGILSDARCVQGTTVCRNKFMVKANATRGYCKNAAALFTICFNSFCVLPVVPQGERRMPLVKTLR
jgi:hypothetical protein